MFYLIWFCLQQPGFWSAASSCWDSDDLKTEKTPPHLLHLRSQTPLLHLHCRSRQLVKVKFYLEALLKKVTLCSSGFVGVPFFFCLERLLLVTLVFNLLC